jgi:prepilin-type N-terminal cleavage/methylation domain-containing protein
MQKQTSTGVNKGLTLIELAVTMTVVALVMAALLVMSREGEAQAALLRSAQKLVLDISRQQASAMSAKEVAGEVPCGYGVHFDLHSGSYILFVDRATQADCSDQDFRLSPGEQTSVSNFEAGVKVSAFNNSDIIFNPPEPRVYFYPGAAPAEITLQSSRTGQTIRVVVTLAGQIMIQ